MGSEAGYAPALDGLRAVAVLLVVLFHLNIGAFDSGFLGVDVFFVISGFLITTLMLREVEATGRLSLSTFWARRVRRLFPALALVLLVVALVSLGTNTPSQLTELRSDLLSTTTYSANFHFIEGASYFSDTGISSPLEHTWSLAIEEQFYVIWPLLVFGALVALRRSSSTLAGVAVAGAVVSAVLLAVHWDPTSVERAYMGTDSRVFEPLIGAAGAAVVARARARSAVERHGPKMAAIGAIGLTIGVILIQPAAASYFLGGAVWVSLMTLAIVAPVWVGRAGLLQRILRWRPLVWLGILSYGIYLWHWPIIQALDARYPFSDHLVWRRIAAFALTIAASATSYYLLERPIRRGWHAERPMLRPDRWRPRTVLASVPLMMVLLTSTSLATTHVDPPTKADFVVMLAGDSVPKRLLPSLERAAEDLDWRFVDSAMGGCPVSGEDPVSPDGVSWTTDMDCRSVVAGRQAKMIRQYDPDLVIWWDRSAISNFLSYQDEVVLAGTPRFWELRAQSLEETTERLAARGATIVFIGTEPVGTGIDSSVPWGGFMVDRYLDVTKPWNDMMSDFAAGHPESTVFVSLSDVVCHNDLAPCDDTIDGVPARPDGQHYFGPGEDLAADALIAQLLVVADDPH